MIFFALAKPLPILQHIANHRINMFRRLILRIQHNPQCLLIFATLIILARHRHIVHKAVVDCFFTSSANASISFTAFASCKATALRKSLSLKVRIWKGESPARFHHEYRLRWNSGAIHCRKPWQWLNFFLAFSSSIGVPVKPKKIALGKVCLMVSNISLKRCGGLHQ